MTDLRVLLDRVQVPHEDCNRAPETLTSTDQCHLVLELAEPRGGTSGPEDRRPLRFDREGDRFVLSEKVGTEGFANRSEDLAWFRKHDNAGRVLELVRVAGSMLSLRGIARPTPEERADRFVFPLVIALYVVEGEVRFPGSPQTLSQSELAGKLLDVFANSNPDAVQDLIGKIAFHQADAKLGADMKQRVRWVLEILRFIPLYQSFLGVMLERARTDLTPEKYAAAVSDLQTFVAAAVPDLAARKRIRFNGKALDGEAAFRALHADAKPDAGFCARLQEAAVRSFGLGKHSALSGVSECHQGLAFARLKPEEAVKQGLRLHLQRPEGLAKIQAEIEAETRRANMPADWLAGRKQIDAVLDVVLAGTEVRVAGEGKRPLVKLDLKAVDRRLSVLFRSTRSTRHREPVLAALGVLRSLLGSAAENSEASAEIGGEVRSVELVFSRTEARAVVARVEAELRRSLRGSELWLPLGEGAVAAGGAAGLGLALGMKSWPNAARQGLGFGGSALLGMGSGALLTHYLLPPISRRMRRPVRNRYLWDLVGGLVGGAIGAGIWGAANFAGRHHGGGRGEPSRFPVDEYGP